MSGINWLDGKMIDGWPSVVQSLQVLFTTDVGTRIMLRIYGASAGQLLGQPMMPATFERFRVAVITAIELWEPRFRVHIGLGRPEANSDESMRSGRLSGLELYGEYRPRGHLGDPTPEGIDRRIFVGSGQSGMEVAG